MSQFFNHKWLFSYDRQRSIFFEKQSWFYERRPTAGEFNGVVLD